MRTSCVQRISSSLLSPSSSVPKTKATLLPAAADSSRRGAHSRADFACLRYSPGRAVVAAASAQSPIASCSVSNCRRASRMSVACTARVCASAKSSAALGATTARSRSPMFFIARQTAPRFPP